MQNTNFKQRLPRAIRSINRPNHSYSFCKATSPTFITILVFGHSVHGYGTRWCAQVSSLLEKKDAANEDLTAIRKEAEETNTTVSVAALKRSLMRYLYIICIHFSKVSLMCSVETDEITNLICILSSMGRR